MMIFSFLEFMFCVSVLLQSGVSEKCNITFQSKLKARTKCFTNYADCGFENLQTLFPTLYNKAGWKRDPPKNITVSPFCQQDSLGVNQSGLNIQWNLPNSHSAAGIAGYELRVEGDLPNFRCLIVILEENATRQNIHFVLNSTMLPLRRNYNYMIVLHSLPRANNSETKSKNVDSMNCNRGSSSMNWTPAGQNYSYEWPEKIIRVWFQPPPLEYNISKFKLNLKTDTELFRIITNTTEVIFTDKEPGIYKLYMEPYDEHRFDKNRCVCRNDEGTCSLCKLSVWTIDAQIPKKVSSPSTKGHLHELIAGVCVFVVIAVGLLLLYKFLAKRYGIECILGKSKNRKTEILHVLCIDTSSSKDDASKLQFILENELNARVKFVRITALFDANISSKMLTMWKHWNIPNSSDMEKSKKPFMSNNTAVCDVKTKSDDKFKICIFLLVHSSSDAKISEYWSSINASIPQTGQVYVQMCAVTFADKQLFPQCKTDFKCYSLNKDKQNFVADLKKAFLEHPKNQTAPVVYTRGELNSELSAKNGVTFDKNSGDYVALTKSQICNGHCPQTEKGTQKISNCEPEVGYLGVSEPRRERYISNDSGRGVSEFSYKPGQSPDDPDGFQEELNALSSAKINHQFTSTDPNGIINRFHVTESECPSCDISFFPPDPSVISENDFDPDAVNYCAADDSVNYKEYEVKQFPQKRCPNCLHGRTKLDANSMDSIMDKMAEINERSTGIIQQNWSPGEVHSVWEGHV